MEAIGSVGGMLATGRTSHLPRLRSDSDSNNALPNIRMASWRA